ncbi:MAG: single-stranded DNA-binding protein [spirochete symbiont of Stewartia floridana]|nr:MAG: single-stranded DNA-binding protein [spirochete symbiont of Stewartia floridana]
MNNLNSIILEGNLTKDPDFKQTPKGTPVCRFTVASNRFYKSEGERQQEVGYFDVEVWSRLAETCGEYLSKGRGVRVVGRLKQDRWTNVDGALRTRIHIIGEHVEFQSKPKSHDAGVSEAAANEKAMKQEAVPAY